MDALTGSVGTCRFLRGETGYDAELSRLSEAERLLGQALQAAEESNRALVTEAAKADGSKNENHPDAEFSDERDDEIRREYADKITRDDVTAVQSITSKSVNKFSSDDIQKTAAFAKKYWGEMGTKSPFFRAWFGDWRANDVTPVQVADKRENAKGLYRNDDTGWDINVSGKVFNETTIQRAYSKKLAVPYLPYIDDIIKKAILLDSFTMGNRQKSENSLLMHSLYAVADIGNGSEVLKLYVEEMNNPNTTNTSKRAYQLLNIEKTSSAGVRVQGNAPSSLTNTENVINNVADLFNAVKKKDKNFDPKPVNPSLLNPDGTPRIVYHGTTARFTKFERGDIGYHVGTLAQAQARIAGENNATIMPLYANINNPLTIGMDFGDWHGKNVAEMLLETEQWENGYDEGAEEINARLSEIAAMPDNAETDRVLREYLQSLGYDGIEYENEFEDADYSGNNENSYIVFAPSQLKSATDNIGTFDGSNEDIRYSSEEDDAIRRQYSGANYWKPKITNAEWQTAKSLVEHYSGEDFSETKRYALKSEKGHTVFVLYSTESEDNPTMLFANSGENAIIAKEITDFYKEDNYGDSGSAARSQKDIDQNLEAIRNISGSDVSDRSVLGNSSAARGNVGVSERQSGNGAYGRSGNKQNRRDSQYRALINALTDSKRYSDAADDAIRKESARKRTERQLRQENERLKAIRRAIPTNPSLTMTRCTSA